MGYAMGTVWLGRIGRGNLIGWGMVAVVVLSLLRAVEPVLPPVLHMADDSDES